MPADTRQHDLPITWDGHAVLWEGWRAEVDHIVICPPVRSCCEGCGSLATPIINRGLVGLWPSFTHADLVAEEENRRRLGSLAHKRKRRALWRLRVIRCPDCRLDTVWDMDTEEWWTLDATDYGDDGSVAPTLAPARQPAADPGHERAEAEHEAPEPDHGDRRALPAPDVARSACHGCGQDIVWATTVAGPNGPGGKLQPFDPHEDPERANAAITQPTARGRLLARALHKGEAVEPPLEYAGITHFATCPVNARPAPPMALVEHQTQHLSRRRPGGRQ